MCELFLRTNKTSIIKLNAHVLVTCKWLSVEHGSPFFPLCFLAFFNVFFWNECFCSTFKFTDQVNDGFVDFVIDIIESAGSGEHGEEVVDALVPLILAFNQHFVGKDTGQKLCQTVSNNYVGWTTFGESVSRYHQAEKNEIHVALSMRDWKKVQTSHLEEGDLVVGLGMFHLGKFSTNKIKTKAN